MVEPDNGVLDPEPDDEEPFNWVDDDPDEEEWDDFPFLDPDPFSEYEETEED